jgi:hypothetical protein
MFDMANLPQVRTVEQLREVMREFVCEAVTDKNLVWFACIGYAETLSDSSLKDLARLFAEGVDKVETLDDVQDFIDTFFEGVDEEEATQNNRYLLAAVARFYGNHVLASQLVDEDE